MSLIGDLARGMLAGRRRQTLVSVLGVALGVGFFIATTAVMRGFQTFFTSQIIDVLPHVTIKDEYRHPLPQAVELAHPGGAIALSGVKPRDPVRGIRAAGDRVAMLEAIPGAAAAPLLTGQALLRYGARDVAASVTGIDPARYRRVSNLEKDLTSRQPGGAAQHGERHHPGPWAGAAAGHRHGRFDHRHLAARGGAVDDGGGHLPHRPRQPRPVPGLYAAQGEPDPAGPALGGEPDRAAPCRRHPRRAAGARDRGALGRAHRKLGGAERQYPHRLRHPERHHLQHHRRHPAGGELRHLQRHLDRGVREDPRHRHPEIAGLHRAATSSCCSCCRGSPPARSGRCSAAGWGRR